MPPRSTTSTTVRAAQPASTAYPKGSPQRTTVKKSSMQDLPFGFTRSTSNVTVNGVEQSRNTTVTSSGGGSAGGMFGPLLIVGGVFMLWVVFRGKSGAMWNALTGDTGFDASLNSFANAITPKPASTTSAANSAASGSVTGNAQDSGTHMGIDSSGNIVTINKNYGDMTDAEKDAANAYAHQIGNVG